VGAYTLLFFTLNMSARFLDTITQIPFLKQQRYAVLCVDLIIENEQGEILIEKSGVPPMKDKWILPSGYAYVEDDNIQASAIRSVKEEIGLDIELSYLIDVLGDPDSKPPADPRFYGVQVIFAARPKPGCTFDIPTEFVQECKWVKPHYLFWKRLGYNHNKVLRRYIQKKHSGKLIPASRSFYTDNFGTIYNYRDNDFMHTVAMGIVLNEQNEILLAHRAQDPFKDTWDLPGGHMYVYESIEECLKREVREELGVECTIGDLFHVYSDKGMSPRFARAMILYFIKIKSHHFVKNVEMDDFRYFPLDDLPSLAYHLDAAMKDIRHKVQEK